MAFQGLTAMLKGFCNNFKRILRHKSMFSRLTAAVLPLSILWYICMYALVEMIFYRSGLAIGVLWCPDSNIGWGSALTFLVIQSSQNIQKNCIGYKVITVWCTLFSTTWLSSHSQY